jgi:hypothetical protein
MLLAVFGAVVILALPSPPSAAGSRSCGLIRADGAPIAVEVIRGRTRCRTARRVLRAYLASDAPCQGSAWVRKHRGWTCATAAALAFPRLASCTRRRARIAAYSTAD